VTYLFMSCLIEKIDWEFVSFNLTDYFWQLVLVNDRGVELIVLNFSVLLSGTMSVGHFTSI